MVDTSICDASRSRHPRDIQLRLLPEITDKVYDIVLTDRRLMRELVEATSQHSDQFCTNNWVRKSYRQDGCRVCSLWTINAIVWRFQNNVWRCFNVIQMNFCVDYCYWRNMDPLLHTRDKRTVNRFHRVNQLRRRRRP